MSTPISVTITRTFQAPLDLVYRAFVDPELAVQWMKCAPDVELEYHGWLPVVGAEFRSTMRKPGQWEVTGTGRFLEVEAGRVLAFQQDANPSMGLPAMTVRVQFAEVDGGTRVTLTHTGVPNDMMRGIIESGWAASMLQLTGVLEQNHA